MRIPTVLHEQNAVLGRVNRLLAGEAEAIGTAYDKVDRLKPRFAAKTVLVGNPVREEIARARRTAVPAVRRGRAAEDPRHRRKPGRDHSRRDRPRRPRLARAVAPAPAAGRPAMPPRRHRAGPRPICRARHPRRASDLYRGHARQARRRASRDRPGRRLDHCRADRRRTPGDPDPVRRGDRRPPDRQRARNDQGRRRAHHPASRASRPSVLARQIEAMAADPVALNNAAARALVGRPPACRARSRRPRRARRQGRRAGRGRSGSEPAHQGRALRREACPHDEGDGHRHRHDPFRRHRRHRHVGHRRGDAPARLQGAGLRHFRQLCRREAAQGRNSGQHRPFAPTISAMPRWSSARRRSRTTTRRSRRPPSAGCRGSSAPKCSPS